MITPTMAGEGMRYFRLRPDARLRPWIKCYWWVEPHPEYAGRQQARDCGFTGSADP